MKLAAAEFLLGVDKLLLDGRDSVFNFPSIATIPLIEVGSIKQHDGI